MKLKPDAVGRECQACNHVHRSLTLFDALLTCAGLIVEGDNPLGRARQVGDDEAAHAK